MLNKDLFFEDKKDIEISRLKKVIQEFKKYDEERKSYYTEKMRRLGELESFFLEVTEAKGERKDLEKVVLRQKMRISELDRIIQAHKIEEARSPEELQEIVDTHSLKEQNRDLRKRVKNLCEANEKLIQRIRILEAELEDRNAALENNNGESGGM